LPGRVLRSNVPRGAQSAVRSALAANDWLCGKSAGTCRAGLVSAGLQHLVSATKSSIGRHPVQRFGRAIAPSDPLSLLQAATAGQWTVPASRRREKANGTRANTVDPNDGYGARYISGLTSKHWKYGQSRSQVAASGMRPFCQTCSTKSHHAKSSAASRPPLGRLLRNRLPGSGQGLRHPQMP
jgi:hypothetical protein